MIKFFRRIRQQNLKSGQLKNYSLYAIGEIFLVVIGILIALQINNWNENNKNKHAEHQLLKDLNQEFQMNQKLLLQKLNDVNEGVEIHKAYLLKLASGKYSYKDVINYEENNIKGVGTSDPVYGVINSLISSGDIKLIRNDSLKYELTSWKDKMADLFENENFHLNNVFKYSDYINERVPKNAFSFYDLPQENIETLFMNLSKELNYRNFIILNGSYLEFQVKPELETVIKACEKITLLISKEI